MRLSFLVAVASSFVAIASAAFSTAAVEKIGAQNALTPGNHFGAPVAPWVKTATPGWYFGPSCGCGEGSLPNLLDPIVCNLFDLLANLLPLLNSLRCPAPPSSTPRPPISHSVSASATATVSACGTASSSAASSLPSGSFPPPVVFPNDPHFNISFTGYNAAIVNGLAYWTFGLVPSVPYCLNMCANDDQCGSVNIYFDEFGKGGSQLLTCALFKGCRTKQEATNFGGQDQGNGGLTVIVDSAVFCKKE
ncbi:hypothetical protein C8J56DRAFT_1160785 [Mycena floridula]|nr:hypothetical protein C8J56DRAFT_1160785 [Mycena floridula]